MAELAWVYLVMPAWWCLRHALPGVVRWLAVRGLDWLLPLPEKKE